MIKQINKQRNYNTLFIFKNKSISDKNKINEKKNINSIYTNDFLSFGNNENKPNKKNNFVLKVNNLNNTSLFKNNRSIINKKLYLNNKKIDIINSHKSLYKIEKNNYLKTNIETIKNNKKKKIIFKKDINFPSFIHCSNIKNKKILVLDLDETLIHSFLEPIENYDIKLDINIYDEINDRECNTVYVKKRPGLDVFINELNKYYKIYIFSSSPKDYIFNIIKEIDKKKVIFKFYSEDDCLTIPDGEQYNIYIKDLKKIEKDLSKVILLDDNITSFTLQEENGIPIKSWYGDINDIELFKLLPLLKKLSYCNDVRTEIKNFVYNKTFSWNKALKWLKNNKDIQKEGNNLIKQLKLKILNIDYYNQTKINKGRFSSFENTLNPKMINKKNKNNLIYQCESYRDNMHIKSKI